MEKSKNAEENFRESSKEISDYKFALDESAIVAITDQQGIIMHVNDNFCKISKYNSEELIGQDHRIINSGYHSKEFINQLWVTIANGKIWKGELKNKAKDGAIYWVDTTIVPFLNEQGKPFQYLAIRADITDRKKSEESLLKLKTELEQMVEDKTKEVRKREAQYHLLLDTMQEGVLFVNNEDEILFANMRFCEMTGYTENELIGKNANEIFLKDNDKEKIKNINVNRRKLIRSSYEILIKTKSGNQIWVNINGSPVLDVNGSVIGSVGTHSDITALKLYTKNLEEIIFSLSHKVRQPVAHILGVSNLLDHELITEEELKKIIGYLKESAVNLDKFTHELTELVSVAKQKTENKNRTLES